MFNVRVVIGKRKGGTKKEAVIKMESLPLLSCPQLDVGTYVVKKKLRGLGIAPPDGLLVRIVFF